MPFEKGQSGNPSGRKKGHQVYDIKYLAAKHGSDCMNVIAEIMLKGETDAVRLSAAKELLDRGYGKPTQNIDANLNATVKFDKDQYDAIYDALRIATTAGSGGSS